MQRVYSLDEFGLQQMAAEIGSGQVSWDTIADFKFHNFVADVCKNL